MVPIYIHNTTEYCFYFLSLTPMTILTRRGTLVIYQVVGLTRGTSLGPRLAYYRDPSLPCYL
jgi:hypothetical protein